MFPVVEQLFEKSILSAFVRRTNFCKVFYCAIEADKTLQAAVLDVVMPLFVEARAKGNEFSR
jgi:hypothetical protein